VNCARCGAALPEGIPCPFCPDSLASLTRSGLDHTEPTREAMTTRVSFAPGQLFGDRYTVIEEIGAGGMGQVYKALDRKLRKPVALKLIRPHVAARDGARERFRRELALAREVTHQNVCRVHDLGEIDGLLYISMEYVEGQTLDRLVQSVGHLSPRQAISLGRQICAGLEAVHERSIVHRDLKPGNIMIGRSGQALVMDFGMAYQHGDQRLTDAGVVLGTMAYLSPEQARGLPTDPRSDVYAVGLMLYEMLTGRRPPGDGIALPLALREPGERCPPPSRFAPEVHAALDDVVMRCLEREPARRYGSAREVEQALAHAGTALSSGSSPLAPRPGRSRSWTALVAAVSAVALVAAAMLARRSWQDPTAAAAPRSVALLPLGYDGPKDKAYLKDVLPLVLGEGLKGSRRLQVAPFASSRTFGADDDPRLAARQLGVQSIVQGKVSVQGETYEVALRTTGDDGRVLWTRTIQGEIGGLFPRADQLSAEMAGVLGGEAAPPRASRPPQALEQYLRGRALLEGWDVDRNYARAEEAFHKAIAADPTFAEAHAMLAVALWKHYKETREPERVRDALESAQRSVALAPGLPEGHLALGIVELGQGRSAEAADSFQKAQDLAPADDAVCRRIAEAYAALGRHAEAEAMYKRAIDLRPAYWDNYNGEGTFFLAQGKLAAAKGAYQKVIDLRPDSDIGYTNLAGAHILGGELKAAEPLLMAAMRIKPGAAVHNNLGFVYYSTGRFEDAVREFRQAVEAVENAARWGNLGDAYRQLGRSAEARQAYGRAIELGERHLQVNPRDGEARGALAMRLAGDGRCDRARKETRLAVLDGAENPTIHYYAAVASSLCQDRTEAVSHAVRAVQGGVVADVRTNPDLRPLLTEPAVRKALGN
jgi:Flp pilus assembly protein TadD/tRNA A-37 threonylcarbamoyl transferase component Bud32/TolB-like protein